MFGWKTYNAAVHDQPWKFSNQTFTFWYEM